MSVQGNAGGNLQIDENLVDERVRASLADPATVERILGQMMKLRDDRGVYAGGIGSPTPLADGTTCCQPGVTIKFLCHTGIP
ncbi:hypothetical protein GALL_369640 [mine drainage metagenome]|uniref:Uncharacterized protein n=1 Tax=mine drainage metagenome TaxID=410659 RepID=A0A1J5QCX4_9ZZZZ